MRHNLKNPGWSQSAIDVKNVFIYAETATLSVCIYTPLGRALEIILSLQIYYAVFVRMY